MTDRKRGLGLLVIAMVLGIILRGYRLGDIPSGLHLDEAAQGFNAYSILKTGADEYGYQFPAIFRSFGDFKTPLYIYSIVPLIKLFGLTTLTTRLPSFLASTLSFPFLYLLIVHLSGKLNSRHALAGLSSLFLAIAPWHVLFGRTTFECNLALFLTLAGIYYLFLGRQKGKFILLASIFLSLAFVAYHTQRLLLPLLVLSIITFYYKSFFQPRQIPFIIVSLIIGITILYPTIKVALTPGFLTRINTLSYFQDPTPPGAIKYSGLFENFINSRPLLMAREFTSLYLYYFSPKSLFGPQDLRMRSSYPEVGVLYFWQMPLLYLGILWLLKKASKDLKFLVICLLIFSPLAAALTKDAFSTIRSLPLIIPFVIALAWATLAIYQLFSQKKQKFYLIAISGLFIYSILKLFSSGFVLSEFYTAPAWNYGWKELTEAIKTLPSNLPIVVDNAREEPYSQLIFYLLPDPKVYQLQNFEVSPDEYYQDMRRVTTKSIGNIQVRPIYWENDIYTRQYIIGDSLSLSDNAIREHDFKLIKEVRYPNNDVALRLVLTQPEIKRSHTINNVVKP